jgi:alpha-methylacyl-CoA racemase
MTEAKLNSISGSNPLAGFHVVTLAINAPGPVAAARLRGMGAAVVKVEPPGGDPLARLCPLWYQELTEGQEIRQLDLKKPAAREQLEQILTQSDLLLTATRPAAMERLGLGWPQLHLRHPKLCQVAIVGQRAPHDNLPGHDLCYQASAGLVAPPDLPNTLLADLAGAERAVSAALALLLERERTGAAGYVQVALEEAAKAFTPPLRHGFTVPGGPLAGGLPGYNLYRARKGWIAVGALEPHFLARLLHALHLDKADRDSFQAAFLERTAEEWESWALQHDLPVVAVRNLF